MKRLLFAILLLLACAPASAQTLPAGYVQCAVEGKLCKVPAPGSIIYGSTGKYLAPKPVTGDTWCNNSVFGWVSMTLKACWFKADVVATPAKWTLWSKALGDFPDSAACIAAASATGPGSYACATTAVTVPQPPPPVVGSAKLSWTAPTTNADGTPLTDLAGYRIYYGTAPGVYGPPVAISSAATLTATITPLAAGQWYFIVRAFDTSGNESAASIEVLKVIP